MIDKYKEQLENEVNGFIGHNGIRIVSIDAEKSVLEADVTENSRNVWGCVHGGLLYAMADTAAGVFARVNFVRRNVTLNGSINYLRPTVRSKKLTAIAHAVKIGGHVGFFEVDIFDDTQSLVARAQLDMYFMD